jgi:hypothetical protein
MNYEVAYPLLKQAALAAWAARADQSSPSMLLKEFCDGLLEAEPHDIAGLDESGAGFMFFVALGGLEQAGLKLIPHSEIAGLRITRVWPTARTVSYTVQAFAEGITQETADDAPSSAVELDIIENADHEYIGID